MIIVVLLLNLIMLIGCQRIPLAASLTSTEQRDTTASSDLPRELDGRSAELLSAFFGLDNGLPQQFERICPGGGRADGMPVIFSHELNVDTLQSGDFRVTTASGNVGKLACVTLLPATDPGELRTVLLVGDYGSAQSDPPVTVEIVGNLYSIDNTVNFKGALTTDVTPFALGDLADNDNNHELCLDTTDVPVSVSLSAGYLTDPNNDLNPVTTVQIEQY